MLGGVFWTGDWDDHGLNRGCVRLASAGVG
jgi:hypothetical protein